MKMSNLALMTDIAHTYESYKYLHTPNHKHNPDKVLDNKYKTMDSIKNKFVVNSYTKGAANNGYRVYRSSYDFMVHLDTMPPPQRTFHEVIIDKQKLKFDIDAEVADFGALLTTYNDPKLAYNYIFTSILDAIRTTFFIVYQIDLVPHNEIICTSRIIGDTLPTAKFSNHIIINGYYVNDHKQAAEFSKRVVDYLPAAVKPFLDIGVNKPLQNFRMIHCHKGDMRIKRVVSKHNPNDCIIGNVAGCELLPDIAVGAAKAPHLNTQLHPDDIARVLEICSNAGILKCNVHRKTSGGMFLFERTASEHCAFCADDHRVDNTTVVTASVNSSTGVVTLFRQCRHYILNHGKDGNHFTIIGEFISAVAPTGETTSWQAKSLTTALETPTAHPLTLFAGVETKHIYDEPQLRSFELIDTLVVHAAMKMGKTKALVDYMQKNFTDGLKQNTIRILSFRQTFSGNIKEKFPDFTLYSDVKGVLNQPRLIIQVESIWRLCIENTPPDLLVLDECEAIFEQFDSGLLRGNFNECFAKFQYLVKHSKHVVLMDAGISNRTYRILAQMRPWQGVNTKPLIYHNNTHKNATDDKYFITSDKLRWLGVLYATVDADERIAVPMSSLAEAKVLAVNLTKRYPAKRIKLYSAETLNSEKRDHFADVNTYWSELDILIYTPTVSAGVSFERKHFSKIFGYFTDMSCPVETCTQMIGRIRDVADKQYFICIAATGNTLPTTPEAIHTQLLHRSEHLHNNYDGGMLPAVEYAANGAAYVPTGDYYTLWVENNICKNLSKNSFMKRFITQTKFTGAELSELTPEVFTANTGEELMGDDGLCESVQQIRDDHMLAKSEIKSAVNARVTAATDISADEFESIRVDMMAQKDITPQRQSEYERYRLRRAYNYNGAIDSKFVAKYNEPKTKQIFKNLQRLACDDPLVQIQRDELAMHKYLLELDPNADLNRKYMFDKHRYALELMKLCGWTGLGDPRKIHTVELAMTLRATEKTYLEHIKSACTEFEIKPPRLQAITGARPNDREYTGLLTSPVSKMLNIMYGVKINYNTGDGNYVLGRNTMFTNDPDASARHNMPLLTAKVIVPQAKPDNKPIDIPDDQWLDI